MVSDVNFRFLPEDLFLDRRFHLMLLAMHIVALAAYLRGDLLKGCAPKRITGAVGEQNKCAGSGHNSINLIAAQAVLTA